MKKLMLMTFVLALSCAVADSRQGTPTDESCESPQVISAVSAIYPVIAVQAHVVGKMPVRIEINENGEVVAATPLEGPGIFLDVSKTAAMLWKFQPSGKHETGRLLFKFVLFTIDDVRRNTGDAFFPPCKVEVRHLLPRTQTVY
jgi:hypothetical protein